MKFPIVFLTTFLVLFSCLVLAGTLSITYAQSTNYVLGNNQSVTSLVPVIPAKKWNLVYQLNPTTPMVSAIQYQPELHTFVTETFTIQSKAMKILTKESIATSSAEVVHTPEISNQRSQVIATPSATVITIDKSATTSTTKPTEITNYLTAKPVTSPAVLPASELDGIFDTYAAEYGLSSGVLKRIAKCESGLRPDALSSNGLYGGLYQFVSSTWSSNRKAMGLDPDPQLRFNAEEAIKTAAFKMSRDGYGAWPVCGRKALAVVI